MNVVMRALSFFLFYVLGSQVMAMIGVGAAGQLIVGIVAGFFAAVVIGDKLANKKRRSASGSAKQDKWNP